MTRKERTKIRRNKYRAWKQHQKQQRSSASAPSAASASSATPVALNYFVSHSLSPWRGLSAC